MPWVLCAAIIARLSSHADYIGNAGTTVEERPFKGRVRVALKIRGLQPPWRAQAFFKIAICPA